MKKAMHVSSDVYGPVLPYETLCDFNTALAD